MDTDDARARFASAPVARLATRNAAGDVDLVPVTFAVRDDGTIVTAVDHKPKRTQRLRRLANVRAVPAVTLLADHYDHDDWTALWWVRVRGLASVVDADESDHAAVVAALVARYTQYRERPPAGAAILIAVTEITGWEASG